jgi:hypothetical protein
MRNSAARWGGLAALALTLGLLVQGNAMASMVIFSALQGQLLLNGQPVAGAELVREFNWAWKEENGSDRTRSDAQGRFSFPAIERRSLLGSLLPHEVVIDQRIWLQHQGKSYDLWLSFKRNYKPNSENEGRPIQVVCHLERSPQRRGSVTGLCEFL